MSRGNCFIDALKAFDYFREPFLLLQTIYIKLHHATTNITNTHIK